MQTIPTMPIHPEEAAIMALFSKPASKAIKAVKVSDEQVRRLQEMSPEERAAFVKHIVEEGNREQ